jgi:hypothetical protein
MKVGVFIEAHCSKNKNGVEILCLLACVLVIDRKIVKMQCRESQARIPRKKSQGVRTDQNKKKENTTSYHLLFLNLFPTLYIYFPESF